MSAPHAAADIPPPVRASEIQLQAVVTNTPAGHTAITPRSTPAASALANEAGPTRENLLNAVTAIAGATLWYAASLYTLPVSIALGLFMFFVFPVFSAKPSDPAVLFTPYLSPLVDVGRALFALIPQSKSATVAADSSPTADRAKRATASSRRTANASINAYRKPATHRTTKSAPTAAKHTKRTGTAGSVRSGINHKS
ncbi:hypothetical protein [Mycobacterium sp. RTGN5]|uniref:hypothetical protein n=1 Tax=Mycobacterium sp. RTGN5 TaxID=3016522 RepID=UPI0029C6E5FF|nr:hypothetical protein [Mycobacterium sp. RTGN5]